MSYIRINGINGVVWCAYVVRKETLKGGCPVTTTMLRKHISNFSILSACNFTKHELSHRNTLAVDNHSQGHRFVRICNANSVYQNICENKICFHICLHMCFK